MQKVAGRVEERLHFSGETGKPEVEHMAYELGGTERGRERETRRASLCLGSRLIYCGFLGLLPAHAKHHVVYPPPF